MTELEQRSMARIEAALAGLGAEHEPPAGWEARVLAAVSTAAPRPKPRLWWLLFAAPAVAAAVIALVIILRPPRTGPLQLALAVDRNTTLVRGGVYHQGDVVRATATGGGPYRAVWVYRDDALVVACPGAPSCRSTKDGLTAEVTLKLLGEYKVVAVASRSSTAAIPAPGGTFDLDVASLHDIAVLKIEPFTVR
jgi:hypothetical protein